MTNDELMAKADEALALAGQMTFADAVELARARQLQIFAVPDGMILTQILNFPRKRVLDCIAAAGTLRGIAALEQTIEAFAIREDCSALFAHGRPSWGYFGERHGWKPRAMLFTKQLTGEGNDR